MIYALVDPRTEEVRYIGRTSNLSERYREHLRERTPIRYSRTGRATDARPKLYSKNNWIQDLADEGFQPIPMILLMVETGPLVVEWEGRYIAYGIQQEWPLLNTEAIVEGFTAKFAARIQASHLDLLHAPFQTIADVLGGYCYQHHWFNAHNFAAFVRAWYVDERDILPEASQASISAPIPP